MKDPIDDFEIPKEWIKRSDLSEDKLKGDVESGKIILLPDGSILRRGYTTGTTASAAAKGAVLSLRKEVKCVNIKTPIGLLVKIDVTAKDGFVKARKFSGDHGFDVTDGIEIVSEAKELDSGIEIVPGKGIGKIDGKPAITKSPMKCIRYSVKEAMDEIRIKGVKIDIYVPKGESIAKKTLNEAYGVYGGISILGTTGFVEPWNTHLFDMKKAILKGVNDVVLTTGRMGLMHAKKLFPHKEVFVIGKRFEILEEVGSGCILVGLPGLITKFGNPGILNETGFKTVKELIDKNPDDKRIDMALKSIKYRFKDLKIILLNYDGSVLREL